MDRASAEQVVTEGVVLAPASRAGRSQIWRILWELLHDLSVAVLFCFFLINFVAQAFRVQGASMQPLLHDDERIIVNKFLYRFQSIERGDIVVFWYPRDPSVSFIKRVVALPGDTVEYRNKRLSINGVEQHQQPDGDYNYVETGLNFVHTEKRIETLGERKHEVLVNPEVPTLHLEAVADFAGRENCSYDDDMVRCKVPEGHYFMLGDNRDNSRDSRYWGFVPDQIGRAHV